MKSLTISSWHLKISALHNDTLYFHSFFLLSGEAHCLRFSSDLSLAFFSEILKILQEVKQLTNFLNF